MGKILSFETINQELDADKQGRNICSIKNFVKILRFDGFFSDIKFNALKMTPEKMIDGKAEQWTDTDDSITRAYIEEVYKIIDKSKIADAFNIVSREREFHPVKDEIEKIKWDEVERINSFFIKWLQCEDSEYTREVSRLIFAGGINRIYDPGCKFDYMPVLIGTKQGEGKSTLIRWLALQDSFYNEVTEIDGQEGIEAIEGAWICELGELLAMTKIKDVEAIKSYLTRQVDKYRRPYEKRVSEHPRQCIFIGTTNKAQFLTDKTGNRRFLPIHVNTIGYDLFDREFEIKEDIRQCWAEAFYKFKGGEMPLCPDRRLIPIIREYQEGALEDDFREGIIIDYIKDCEKVCIIELWEKALKNDYKKPTKKDSTDIAEILQKIGWECCGNKRFPEYGCQKSFSKPLPFGQGALENLPANL